MIDEANNVMRLKEFNFETEVRHSHSWRQMYLQHL